MRAVLLLITLTPSAWAGPNFVMQEVDRTLGVGYAVRLLDMNRDGRLDIVVVDQQRIVWLENPGAAADKSIWKLHAILEGQTKPDNVCFAPMDINGDGRIDFAIGADWRFTPDAAGPIHWLEQPADPTRKWMLHPLSAEPFVHRMQWVDLGRGQPELVIVPLLGVGATQNDRIGRPIRVIAYSIPAKDKLDQPWPTTVLNDQLHVAHNFVPTDLDRDGKTDLVVASFEGLTWLKPTTDGKWSSTHIATGDQMSTPNKGCSEVKYGKLANSADYLATVEPWHGHQIVVYTRPTEPQQTLWRRLVIDDDLKWGHAVWCANLDSDPEEELIIGVRDNKDKESLCGVRIYDPSPDGMKWQRTLVDPGGVAIEDLAVADLDQDGKLDLVAVGRATHNVRIYWQR